MPKKYQVDLIMTNLETKTEVASDRHLEEYDDDDQANERFQLKKAAARKEGKGSG